MKARRTRRTRQPLREDERSATATRRPDASERPHRIPLSTGEEPLAAAGPVLSLNWATEQATSYEEERGAKPGPTTQGQGTHRQHTVRGQTSLRLAGLTRADYDGGSFHTEGTRLRPAEDCGGCSGSDCIHVTGTLVATYHVTTTVTLPSADDYPDLTPCQRRRVQHAIDTILAPHEQEHVRAFRRYNGTTRRRFDLTLCRSAFDTRIQEMFEAEEAARRQAAQAASDALDPFHFDVDLDCEEAAADVPSPSADSEPEAHA